MSRDWDWLIDDPSVCVPEQAATAVYCNTRSAIVIRQQGAWDQDEDLIVIVQVHHAETVARAILAVADGIRNRNSEIDDDVEPQSATRKTGNATRQQRYRDKKRNAPPSPDRNAHDAETVTRDVPQPSLKLVGDNG